MKPEPNQRRTRRRKKQGKEVSPTLARPIQPKLLDIGERGGHVPDTFYKKISPCRKITMIPFANVIGLMYEGKLTSAILSGKYIKVKPDATWLKCFAILEAHGVGYGVNELDLADHLGLKPRTIRTALLKAQFILAELFGLNFGFWDGKPVYKCGTDEEILRKFLLQQKETVTKNKRQNLLLGVVEHVYSPVLMLQIPLFDLPELHDGDAKPRFDPN